jgi:molybdopterin molybdotransferase
MNNMKSELTPIDTALKGMLESLSAIQGTEQIEILQSTGRILTEDIVAPVDVPGADNSAMDGYAVNSEDIVAAPVTLPISQRIAAGTEGVALERGTIARIFTGAPIPPGADAVVMQENCEISGSKVKILQAVGSGENVRRQGNDVEAGTTIFSKGHRLRAQDVGVLAAAGLATVTVARRLKVAVLTTGDELVRPGSPLNTGQIYNSNFYAIASMLQSLTADVLDLGIVADNLDSTMASLDKAATEADCIISSGGVSVGEEDHVKAAVTNMGDLALWKLAIKPGKPFAFGSVRNKPFFGLPGNPVSAFVTFILLVKPALLKLSGARDTCDVSYPIPAGFTSSKTGERQEYLRVSVTSTKSGSPSLTPFDSQSSGVGSSISLTDGLAVVPPFTSVEEGDMLRFLPFNELIL